MFPAVYTSGLMSHQFSALDLCQCLDILFVSLVSMAESDVIALSKLNLGVSTGVEAPRFWDCSRPSDSSELSSRHTPEQANSGIESRNCSEAGFSGPGLAARDDSSLGLSECSTSGRCEPDDQAHEPLLREYADRFTMHPIR